jgi:chromosome segregation ATPase
MTTDLTAELVRLQGELRAVNAELSIRERQLARLDAENTRLRKENDDISVGLGLADGPRRQSNDVIDVAPDLTAALTEHEVTA